MRLFVLFFTFCLLTSQLALAQMPKKASKAYLKAFHYKARHRDTKAFKKMSKSIAKNPDGPEAYSEMGRWYFEEHEFNKAVETFKSASLKCPNGAWRFAKPLAKSYIYAGRPDNALQLINNYSTLKDSAEWNKLRRHANFVKYAMARIQVGPPLNLGSRVNSKDPELFPSMAADTQELYFTRRVNNMDDDLFKADVDTCGGWLAAENMGDPMNSPDQENSLFISADGHYLFFTRCENRRDDSWGEGGCDLFMAYRVAPDSEWTIAQPFGSTINSAGYEGMPTLSPDNRELFFVSDRDGGFGGYDIWVSKFEDGLWQMPVNAGPNVNTAGNETAPYINADNKSLYFSSDGWPGMGGSDLYMSRRMDDSTWGPSENLGYPINTAFDEKSSCIKLDGSKLYFASDRQGPAGNYDIYESDLPGNLKPGGINYLKGYVYDSISRERLNYATLHISDAKSGKLLYKFHSNRGDGSYLIPLEKGKTYALHTERMEHTAVDDTFEFKSDSKDLTLVHNVCMLPSGYLAPISDTLLATLHFDVNIVELGKSDKDIVRDAITPWLDQKAVVVMVNAYTDNTGTPMINETLSFKRANIAAKQVIALGIPELNVIAKGWGEAKMIAPNDTEEGQRKNRRVEIILRR